MSEKSTVIHNCEKAIIGAMIQDPNWLTVSKKYLEDVDFACDSSRVLFQFFKKLESQNKRWDKTILKSYIPLLPVQVTEGFIEECISLCIDTNHCPDYLKEVKDTSIMRKLIEETKKMGAEQEGIAIKDILQQYRTKMDTLLNELPSEDDFNLTEKLLDMMEEIEENRKEGSKAIKTGFDSFDKFWGGVKPNRLYCIGARPGFGKTSWLETMVANMLKDPSNVRVIIFSLEMSVVEVLMRMLSIISQVKSRKFEIPELLEDADMAKITKAAEWLSARQLVVIDKHCNMSDIEMISKKYKPNVIIVDFVQHMRFSAREMEHFALSLSTRVKELKVLAKQLNAVVWMASQISREYERGGHRLPVMSDLKESGGLEECADFVCFLHWPFKLSPDTDYENDAPWEEDTKKIVSLVVAKARFGETGIIKLLFDYEYTTFKNMYLGKEDYNVEN